MLYPPDTVVAMRLHVVDHPLVAQGGELVRDQRVVDNVETHGNDCIRRIRHRAPPQSLAPSEPRVG